jgi:hypothetical protein
MQNNPQSNGGEICDIGCWFFATLEHAMQRMLGLTFKTPYSELIVQSN